LSISSVVEVRTGMGRYSYIRQQIDNYRSTLKEIEEKAGVSPEDEGLKELNRIFANRIASLELILPEDDRGLHSRDASRRDDFRDAA